MIRTAKTRILFFVAWDVILISLSVYLSFILRFDADIPSELSAVINKTIIFSLLFYILIYYFWDLYSFSWSYVSSRELISLVAAGFFGSLFVAATIFLSKDFPSFVGFPRSVLVINYILILLLTGGIRFSKRIYLQIFKKDNHQSKEKTLIVGAGDAGEQVLRSIQGSALTPYSVVGFIDDNPFKKKSLIHGVPVRGGIDDILEIVEKDQIKGIIVALPSAQSLVIKKAVAMARKAGIKKIKILPLLSEIVDGNVSVNDIRDFKLEDLLDREPILYDNYSIEKFIKGKIILVTGSAGSIGSELSRQIIKFNPSSLLLLDQDETGMFNIAQELREKFPQANIYSLIADIQDEKRIRHIFNKFRPQIVFHAAAYKHVPLMEKNPSEAIKNNILGTKIVAQACLDVGVEKFVFISTDKAVNPKSIMGITKRIGEMICQILNQKNVTKFVSVRFGNVLGSRGSVIPIFKKQIEKGGPVRVTHEDMKRYFMIIPEAVSLVLQAGDMGQGGEVFVLNMGDSVRILDLAKQLIRLSGLEPDKDIPIIFTEPRSGEKFSEEILTAEEGTIATENKNIYKARFSLVDENKMKSNLEVLKNVTVDADNEQIKNILQNFIA